MDMEEEKPEYKIIKNGNSLKYLAFSQLPKCNCTGCRHIQ